MNIFSGYKTYICAALYVLTVVGEAFGVIDKTTAETLKGVTFGGGLAALRAGISKKEATHEKEG